MLASRHPHAHLIPHLLSLSLSPPTNPSSPFPPPNPLQATDHSGNTPLHYASAYGSLKAIRVLLEQGADAGQRNVWAWTAVGYSASVQAEVYFKGLVGGGNGEGGRRRGGSAGERMVAGEGRSRGGSGGREREAVVEGEGGRSRGGSGGRVGGLRMVSAEGGVGVEGRGF